MVEGGRSKGLLTLHTTISGSRIAGCGAGNSRLMQGRARGVHELISDAVWLPSLVSLFIR